LLAKEDVENQKFFSQKQGQFEKKNKI